MTSVEGDNNVNDHGHIREIYPITHNNYNVNDDCGDDDVNLRMPLHDSEPEATLPSPSPSPPSPLLYWVKLGVSIICLSILGFVVINWVGPFFIQKVYFSSCIVYRIWLLAYKKIPSTHLHLHVMFWILQISPSLSLSMHFLEIPNQYIIM
jgi:hypothetical protein